MTEPTAGVLSLDDVAAMMARANAADSEDEWGRGRVELTWTSENPGREAAVWYDDGDLCAEVARLRLALESVRAQGSERQPVGPPPYPETTE